MTTKILLVGCGKMGSALLSGWLDEGIASNDIVVVEPALDAVQLQIPDGVQVVADAGDIAGDFAPAVVVFAVKPQVMAAVAPVHSDRMAAGAVALSIAAGTPIRLFEEIFGAAAAIVRVMPNTPAAIGRGISVLCANPNTSTEQKDLCGRLMLAAGTIDWIEDEGLMDAVTATSGSGPAYVFLLIECLAEAGRAAGLPEDLARKLALETVAGAGELARQSEDDPAQLRVNVTSPGGTTEAALKVLMASDGLQALMTAAVSAAEQRGRELAG